jgi:hypothetical protein
VSIKQRENLEAVLRQSAFPVGSDVSEQRRDDHGTKREVARCSAENSSNPGSPAIRRDKTPLSARCPFESALGQTLSAIGPVRRRRRHRPVPGPRPPLFVTGQAIVMNGGPVN